MDISELESQKQHNIDQKDCKVIRDTQNTADNMTQQQIDKVQTE